MEKNSEAEHKTEDARPDTPADLRAYAGKTIASRLDRMLSHTEGVKKGEADEPVHQMRVWSRRSRAALEVFADCFPGKAYAELEREVKAVTDALGEARDLDVMVGTLSKRAEGLPPEQRAGIEGFIEALKKRRDAQQKPVVRAIARMEHHDLAHRLTTLIENPPAAPKRARKSKDTHG